MANANKPTGLSPVQYLNGAPWSGQARIYAIKPTNAGAIYIGDPVMTDATFGSDANGVPAITNYTGGSAAIRGVVVGIGRYEALMANPNGLNITYFPAGGDSNTTAPWYAMVADDPNILFEVQENTQPSQTQLAPLQIGLNTTLQTGTGNGFLSGWQLSNYTNQVPATTATLPIRLMGLKRSVDNAFGAYAKHLVKINVHELGQGTGSAGV